MLDFNKMDKKYRYLFLTLIILIIIALVVSVYDDVIQIFKYIFNIVLPIILGIIVAYVLIPIVRRIQKVLKNRALSIFLSYIFVITIVSLILGNVIPFVADFFVHGSKYLMGLDWDNILNLPPDIVDYIVKVFSKFFSVSAIITSVKDYSYAILSIGGTVLFTFIISLYILGTYEKTTKVVQYLFPPSKRKKGMKTLYSVSATLRSYLKGLVIVAIINGGSSFIFYKIIGLENAIGCALIVGMLFVIPYFGIPIASIPALIIASTHSLYHVIGVIVFLTLMTNISGAVIEPRIYGSRVNVDPLVIVIGFLIISALWGFVGMVLAGPIVSILATIVYEFKGEFAQWFDEVKTNED